MKKYLLSLTALCFLPFMAFSQYKISGKVTDKLSETNLPYATISIENTHIVVLSNVNGAFEIRNVSEGTYKLKCTFIGYSTYLADIHVNKDVNQQIELEPSITLTDEFIVRATRSTDQTPIAQSIITKNEVQSMNLGQDLPFLINQTPSVVTTSDAGAGIGYTGIRIRGSDATRVNVTVNGIPINDSESHSMYWVDMPDIISSVENIQIQRGVGTSTNGAGAFGASINLQTNILNSERYAELSNAVGSFNSMKNTISFGTGLLPCKWAFDGRMSRIVSDGYIDRASSNLNSYYLSAGYYGKKDILKLIHFSGKEKTYQAWNGVPKDSLLTNRTFNSAGLYTGSDGQIKYYENETDNYQQDYFQIHYSHQFNRHFTFNAAGHLTNGKGYYEQYKQDDKFSKYDLPEVVVGNDTIDRTDIIRQLWLDNKFYGATYSLNYNSFANFSAIFGGAYNKYDGQHYGEIIWAEISKNIPAGFRYYNNLGYKTDLNNFIKINYQWRNINFFADMQHRRITYTFMGKAFVDNDIADVEQVAVFNFLNPKAGLTLQLNPQNSIYGFWGVANREPVRDDFTQSTSDSRPKAETLNNFEFGYKRNEKRYLLGANVFLMNYKNQLVLTGEINDVGDYTRKNIDGSYRAGLELEGNVIITKFLTWGVNLTYSQNKIKNYKEYYDVYDSNIDWIGTDSVLYENTNISFSPELIAGSIINIKPYKGFNIDLMSKYVGEQYIDNTSNKDRMLDAYLVNDIKLSYNCHIKFFKEAELTFLINNVLDQKYVSNAWVYNGIVNASAPVAIEDGYFPQAGRNYLIGLNLKF